MWYFFYLVRSLDIAYYLTALMMGVGSYLVLMNLQVGRKQRTVAALLITYVFLVMSVTVLSRDQLAVKTLIYSPFWKYREILRGSEKTYSLATEILLNILMLVPVGFLLPMLVKKYALLYGFLCCFCIECFQLVTRRGFFEVDDLLHNSLGVVIGYLLYLLLSKLFVNSRKR